jgi:hypothetical protein
MHSPIHPSAWKRCPPKLTQRDLCERNDQATARIPRVGYAPRCARLLPLLCSRVRVLWEQARHGAEAR